MIKREKRKEKPNSQPSTNIKDQNESEQKKNKACILPSVKKGGHKKCGGKRVCMHAWTDGAK